jgi:cohesin complex subunit SCC1
MAMTNTQIPNPSLNMPEGLAEPEILPMLDESLLFSQPMDLDFGSKDNDPLNWTSQISVNEPSIEMGRHAPPEQPVLYDDDLDLDIDMTDEPSIEVGRNAPAPRSVGDDLISEDDKFHNDDLGLNYDNDEPLQTRLESEQPAALHENPTELDTVMPPADIVDNTDNFAFDIEDERPVPPAGDNKRQNRSQSPLSSVRSSVVRDLDITAISEEPSIRQARQPALKKRRLLPLDAETTLHSSVIKQQQADRSAILKPMSFLPRDPILLTLMNMQKNGGFVSSIMGDGRAQGWAPELRGILSIEVIRKVGQKRKRDSGVADVGEEEQADKETMPQIEIPDDDNFVIQDEGVSMGADQSRQDKSVMFDLPTEEEAVNGVQQDQDEDETMSPPRDNFEETTAPLVHPADSGPVSLGTQHAVHLLRDLFGEAAEHSPSQQKKANVLFHDLLPEATTSKADATKMFFEMLVLATKDAIKVEQAPGELGGPIRVRAKRGLWGAWAEKDAGGEIAKEAEVEQEAVAI